MTGFMRAKSRTVFSRALRSSVRAVRGDYTEGNACSTRGTSHDVQGLVDLLAAERFAAKLDSLFELEGDAEKYKHVEDIAGSSSVRHGNEPSQHIAYLYSYAECVENAGADPRDHGGSLRQHARGICGNEDCGRCPRGTFQLDGVLPVCREPRVRDRKPVFPGGDPSAARKKFVVEARGSLRRTSTSGRSR